MTIQLSFETFPEDYEPSEELADLLQSAFDTAMNMLDESESLVPLLIESRDTPHLTEFEEMDEEDALESASERLSQAPSATTAYALAYLALLSVEDETFDIVVVEGAERSMDHAYRVFQVLDGQDHRVLYHGHAPQRFVQE
jgi:hypothetical protein